MVHQTVLRRHRTQFLRPCVWTVHSQLGQRCDRLRFTCAVALRQEHHPGRRYHSQAGMQGHIRRTGPGMAKRGAARAQRQLNLTQRHVTKVWRAMTDHQEFHAPLSLAQGKQRPQPIGQRLCARLPQAYQQSNIGHDRTPERIWSVCTPWVAAIWQKTDDNVKPRHPAQTVTAQRCATRA